ncbi:MAG TPA: hypothetical protein VHB21_14245, partial [Minicystis sp.]|nr:hypothetical protein [Minicystis sp.]
DHDLWTQSYPFTQMIGIVPVVEVVELSVGVGVQVDVTGSLSATAGGTMNASVSAGAEYLDGQWHAVGDHYVSMQPLPVSVTGNAEVSGVRGYVYLDLAVKLYDVAGPAIWVAPYVGLYRDDAGAWGPRLGVSAEFDGRVALPIIDKDWNPYSATLFDVHTDFGAGTGSSGAGGGGSQANACGDVTWQGSCEDGVAVYCDGVAVQREDCASQGLGCGFAGDDQGYWCVQGCGDLDEVGACAGSSLRYCDQGQVVTYDCGGDGLSCGYRGDAGYYDCL